MVVAHWINMQYYFSTVDPDVFAAGDKTVHNIVAGVGVTEGAGGDLKVGLPLQSLFVEDRAFHEPLRLLTVVEAPLDADRRGHRPEPGAARALRRPVGAPCRSRRALGSVDAPSGRRLLGPVGPADHGITPQRQHDERTGGPRWMTRGS